MSEFENKIIDIESNISKIETTLNEMKEQLKYLKNIAWDRQSKRKSSSMYKVLKDKKEYTKVQSDVGEVKVDKDFMQKQIKKHLDNPALRGMVSTQEMLSFPKVVKNVKAKYDERQQGYTWSIKANDESVINYGERDYGEGHRLLTAHSKTGRGERGQLRQEFNDRNFHNPVSNENSNTKELQSQATGKEMKIKALKDKAKEFFKRKNQNKTNYERGFEK